MKSKRNPIASSLRSPLFRKRVVPAKKGKVYNRKDNKLSLDMANCTDSKPVRESNALVVYVSNHQKPQNGFVWADGETVIN